MSSRLDRVEALFHAALELPQHEREAYLRGATDDVALREEASRLLRHHSVDDNLLQRALHSAVASVTAAVHPDIGAYRVLRELGAGGMGTVFLAERDVGTTRQHVAIKLIRGYPTQDARARLLRERSLLAGLNHPNIAGLIDGGETAHGQPYLVMEYVEGLPLHRYCTEHALTLRSRLSLFTQLCRAVQHAHQRLIVHRDIKPGNVQVRADGTPVLLDFGIGKLLDQTDVDATATRVFTPAYAAPEQRQGRGVTTAADIYGLGCVLFELLTDRVVADVGGAERGIPPPSQFVAATQARVLRGDLDTVVAKATHPLAERRYVSAQALADDVGHYLAGRPLQAAPDSLSYRTRKFLGRHRLAALASAAFVLAIGVFVWRLDVEREHALAAEARAERETRSTRRSRDFLVSLFEAAAPGNTLGRPLTARELIDSGRARLGKELADEPDSAARLGLAIADVYAALGDPNSAVETGQAALKLVTSDNEERALLRADILERVGVEYDNLDRTDEGGALLQEALALRQHYAPGDKRGIASVLIDLGTRSNHIGELAQAKDLLEQALLLLRQIQPTSVEDVTGAYAALAENARMQEHYAQSLQFAQQALDAARDLPAQSPERRELWRVKAQAQIGMGDPAGAAATLREALATLRTALGEQNTAVANTENDLATALSAMGDYRGTIEHLESAIRILKIVRPDDPIATAIPELNIGCTWESLGDYEKSERFLRAAIATMEKFTPDDPSLPTQRSYLAQTLSFAGKYAEAKTIIDRALASLAEGGEEQAIPLAVARFRASRIESRADHLDAAESLLRQATDILEPALSPTHQLRGQIARSHALIARGRKDFATAKRHYEAAIAIQSTVVGGDPVALAEMRSEYAGVLLALGEREAAHAQWLQAMSILQRDLLSQSPTLIEAQALFDR
jgi:tetratricopeptide (TPR) repeat protein/tRNA A-37 threonylcarbamoyl transferase component Bud32